MIMHIVCKTFVKIVQRIWLYWNDYIHKIAKINILGLYTQFSISEGDIWHRRADYYVVSRPWWLRNCKFDHFFFFSGGEWDATPMHLDQLGFILVSKNESYRMFLHLTVWHDWYTVSPVWQETQNLSLLYFTVL